MKIKKAFEKINTEQEANQKWIDNISKSLENSKQIFEDIKSSLDNNIKIINVIDIENSTSKINKILPERLSAICTNLNNIKESSLTLNNIIKTKTINKEVIVPEDLIKNNEYKHLGITLSSSVDKDNKERKDVFIYNNILSTSFNETNNIREINSLGYTKKEFSEIFDNIDASYKVLNITYSLLDNCVNKIIKVKLSEDKYSEEGINSLIANINLVSSLYMSLSLSLRDFSRYVKNILIELNI